MSFCVNLLIEEEADMNKADTIVTVTIKGQWHKTGV